jgi:hypothetical protein
VAVRQVGGTSLSVSRQAVGFNLDSSFAKHNGNRGIRIEITPDPCQEVLIISAIANIHRQAVQSTAASEYRVRTTVVAVSALTLLLGACSSYRATAERQEDLRYEAVRVQPGWQYQDRPAQKMILPAIGAAAGAAYGYHTEFTYGDETFEGRDNAALWAGVGLVGGLVLNRVLLPKRPRTRRPFDPSQSNEWLRSWNRATGSDYIISDRPTSNSLILVPRSSVLAMRQEVTRLERDLMQARPSTSHRELQEWRRKLSAEYSILPASEVGDIERLISENESKVASADLESQMPGIEAMEPTYATITTLLRLSRDLGPVYHRADPETRRSFDGQVRDKIGAVLTRVLPEEERRIERVGESMAGIEELNGLFGDFDRRYGMLRDHVLVDAVYVRFHEKKEAILIANAAQIAAQIDAASSVDRVEGLEARYSVALRSDRREVTDVRRRLSQRKEAIIAAERQARIATQAAAQRRAQEALAAEHAALAAENARLTPTSFSARGLRNDALMTRIFRGEFADIDLERDDMRFSVLYNAYLQTYARQCPAHLPSDRIEMTRQVCTQWMVTTRGGVETNRSCTGWQTVRTGLYADPEMYQAKRELDLLQASDALRSAIGMLSANDPLLSALNLVGDVTTIQNDMTTLLRVNACDSPGLERFQDNLRLFALSRRPKRLAGEVVVSSVVHPPPGTLFEDQDYSRLIEDLVFEQSKSWVMNRYVRGSVSNVSVSSRDALGRPTRITAQYVYSGFSDRSRGSVSLTFDDGWPECLYFFDNPVACRTPTRRFVYAYADGAYRK